MGYYKQIDLKTWSEFKELVEEPRLEWIYRGQSNSEWELETSLERSNIIDTFSEFEKELYDEFRKGAPFYLGNENLPITRLQWFSMMQHFGAPSRLMDFTKSPYIAAYFAFEQASPNAEKIAIWVVNKIYLFQKALYYFKNKIEHPDFKHHAFDDDTFEKVYNESLKDGFNCVFPLEPKQVNQRYHLQQSIFVCQGNPYGKFINQLDFIGNLKEDTFMKITIPNSESKIAIRDLIKMNITRASLFPGLEGFAMSLFVKYENLSTFGEMSKKLSYYKKKGLA